MSSVSSTMAGWLEGVKIHRHVRWYKAFLDVAYALIFIAVCMNVRKLHAQEAGFLSIDCGNTETNYTEHGLEWVADDGTYIKTGNSSELVFQNSSLDRPLKSFRYFPEPSRSKYCYELPTPNVSYLFRASFYLNEDLLHTQRPFRFIMSIDANNWFSVESGDNSDEDLFIVQEGIFYPPNYVTNFCLQPVYGVPFISSLELRSMVNYNAAPYNYRDCYFQYLALTIRYNLGAESASPDVRYPYDQFDRIWKSPDTDRNYDFPIVVSPEPPDNMAGPDAFYVPPKVMQTAWLLDSNKADYAIFPAFANGSQFSLTTRVLDAYVVVYSEYLNSSTSSSYNLEVDLDFNNSQYLWYYWNYYNFSRQPIAVPMAYFHPGSDTINVSLSLYDSQLHLVNVTDGPTMNAIEIYTQCDYNTTLTKTEDVDVITDLKTGFSLTDWQGDPCVPVPNDWLSCIEIQSHMFSTYYVNSLNISELTQTGFINMNASSENVLNYLNEMSITKSGVDDRTSQILINYCPSGLSILNLSYNALTSLPISQRNTIDHLVTVDLSYNQLQHEISYFDKWIQMNSQYLQQVIVSNNNLSGTFNSSLYFSHIPNLTIVNFDQNSIQGVLDLSAWYDALQEASIATSENQSLLPVTLQLFSFVNNSISNVIPSAETIASPMRKLLKENRSFFTKGILLGGNPYCKGAKSHTQRYLCRSSITEVIQDQNKDEEKILLISIIGGFLALFLCCAGLATLWRLRLQVYSLREIQKALADREVQPPFYQYADLKLATEDFHNHNKLGVGGFGIVYKGILADQTLIAIKKLFISQRVQALDEFLNEVILITGIKHRNLIQLKGCCVKDKERMLVYEYAENGNLAEALWGSKAHSKLNWEIRFNVCLGVARGLSYLHEELQPSIIHRDIKPENILLDKYFKPKIADFGLARHFLGETTQAQYTQISNIAGTSSMILGVRPSFQWDEMKVVTPKGTQGGRQAMLDNIIIFSVLFYNCRGYFAPEYAMHGQLSEKADVYSYGILLLEVVSGRKCIDLSRPIGEKILIDWVVNMRKKKLLFDVLQPELRHACVVMDVIRTINIGVLCTHHDPKRRPSMSQVVTMFIGNLDIEVFLGELDNAHSNLKDIFTDISLDMEYPLKEEDDEDSAIFPLMNGRSESSPRITRRGSNSAPLIELSSIHGR